MALQGHYNGEVVILDEPAPSEWTTSTRVLVEAIPASSDGEAGLSQALLRIAARAKDLGLPTDFSEQHDHYIHGTPKR